MQNFPPLLKSWARRLWKWIAGENQQELQQWLHMFDTSLIQVFHQPVFYSYGSKNISLENKTSD